MQSTGQNMKIRKAWVWKALSKTNKVWISTLSCNVKIFFFTATVDAVLLNGSEGWTLLNDTCTCMLRKGLNISLHNHIPNTLL